MVQCWTMQGWWMMDKATPKRTSSFFAASAKASWVAKVLLPTPPLPESTRILCFTFRSRSSIARISGSGPLGAEAHAA